MTQHRCSSSDEIMVRSDSSTKVYKVSFKDVIPTCSCPASAMCCRTDRGSLVTQRGNRCEDGEPVEEIGSDGGEPEDNSFLRDWKWVAPALQEAYELGRAHGMNTPPTRYGQQ